MGVPNEQEHIIHGRLHNCKLGSFKKFDKKSNKSLSH